MPSTCAVAVCRNRHTKGGEVHFFSFPKSNPRLKNTWITRCYRKHKFNADTSYICSAHFTNDDYVNFIEQNLMGNVKLRLKPDAIPTLKLKDDKIVEPESSRRSKRYKQRTTINECLKNVEDEMLQPANDHDDIVETTLINDDDNSHVDEQKLQLIKRIEELTNQLRNNRNMHEQQLQTERRIHEQQLKKQQLQHETDLIATLSQWFTPAQIDLLLKKRKRVKWTERDIQNAFSIRYFSKRCYIFMRSTLHYPLPGISTLNIWASNVSLKDGLFGAILELISIAGKKMSLLEKLVVLQYDEMKVAEMYEYDRERDKVVGPHKYVQVIQARSLAGKWKQPIYCAFDQKVTKDILFDVVISLYQIGFRVVACVSDCGSTNTSLWSILGVNVGQPWIEHPKCSSKIYFFADAPHLLKLIRNWLLDKGFELDTHALTKDHLKALIEQPTEVNSMFKINHIHLECRGSRRQTVSLAAQLLSRTVSKGLERYVPADEDDENRRQSRLLLAKFVQTVNDWFDVMNSYTRDDSLPTKSAYGYYYNIRIQDEALDKMYATITKIRCIGKKEPQLFQKAIAMSIRSLRLLFADLRSEFKLNYVATHKLNQDALENLFSQLRMNGGCNDHPSPLDFLNRLRVLTLGKNSLSQSRTNTVDKATDEDYLIGKLIRTVLPNKKKTNPDRNMVSSSISDVESSSNDLIMEYYFDDVIDDFENVDASSSVGVNGNDFCGTTTGARNENCTDLAREDVDSDNRHRKRKAHESGIDTNMREEDGFQYLAGWIAFKYKNTHAYMGYHSYAETNEHGYAQDEMPKWVKFLSYGGLMVPSDSWLQQFKTLNVHFDKYFNIKTQPIVETIVKQIFNNFQEVESDVVKTFVR